MDGESLQEERWSRELVTTMSNGDQEQQTRTATVMIDPLSRLCPGSDAKPVKFTKSEVCIGTRIQFE
ncbi:hypothetical protein ACOSQ2_008798 [Xanthoceras sorbifolium]